MAGFCTRCGRPLPEDGKCPFCAPAQQPQQPYQQQPYQQPYQQPVYTQQQGYPGGYAPQPAQPQQPSAFSVMIKNYFSFLGAYIKSPVEALRRVHEDRDIGPALINAVLLLTLTLFSALFTALRFRPSYYGYSADFAWGFWLLITFVQPVLGLGCGLGGAMLSKLVGRDASGFRSVLASTGASAILPIAALAVMMLFQLISYWFYSVMWMLVLIAAAVAMLVLVLKVFRTKTSLWQLLVLCGVLLVGFLLLNGMQNLFMEAIFAGF